MRAYADTSFLFALVLHDANSSAAGGYLRAHRQALPLTSLQRCELKNAVRLALFRKKIDANTAQAALAQIEAGMADGDFIEAPLIWPVALEAADRIGERHTATVGIRTLDLLHVGAALSLGAKEFLTFDARQGTCARVAGLRVGP